MATGGGEGGSIVSWEDVSVSWEEVSVSWEDDSLSWPAESPRGVTSDLTGRLRVAVLRPLRVYVFKAGFTSSASSSSFFTSPPRILSSSLRRKGTATTSVALPPRFLSPVLAALSSLLII